MSERKQRHLILFANEEKLLKAWNNRNQSIDGGSYATERTWAGNIRTPCYTTHERLPCGVHWKETLWKHEEEDWQEDIAGFEFYGLTIHADNSEEAVRWALSRVRGLWEL